MDEYSINLRKRILNSYVRSSKRIIRISRTQDHPCDHLSYLELHKLDDGVWFVGRNFYIVHKGIRIDIPEGYCICLKRELNIFSRMIFNGRFHRCIIALVWFRDVMEYNVTDVHCVVDSVLKCEGFGKIARCFLLLLMRLK